MRRADLYSEVNVDVVWFVFLSAQRGVSGAKHMSLGADACLWGVICVQCCLGGKRIS